MTTFDTYYKKHRTGNPLQWPDINVVRLVSKSTLPTPKECSILDLGCGEGRNLRFLLEKGYSPTCVDASETALQIIKELYKLPNSQLVQGDAVLTLHKLVESSFDLALCWGLSHYVEDTAALIKGLYRVLKPQGVLVMSFQSTEDSRIRADQVKHLFNDDKIRHLMNQHGFAIEEFGKHMMINYSNDATEAFYWVRAVAF